MSLKYFGAASLIMIMAGVLYTQLVGTKSPKSDFVSCKELDEHGSTWMSAVSCAAQWSEHAKVGHLLQAGADVNEKDEYGFTPLMDASDIKTARLLLAHGADLTALNSRGENVLAISSHYMNGSRELFKFFLWKGVDLYHKNNNGESVYSITSTSDPIGFSEVQRYLHWQKRHRPTSLRATLSHGH